MTKKFTRCLLIRGIDVNIDFEVDNGVKFVSLSSDGYPIDQIQPLLDALKTLQTPEDLEYQDDMQMSRMDR